MEKNMLDILRSFDSASIEKTPTKVDSSGMLSILQKFDLVESSPTSEGLDKQQKSVNQLSAEFKPKTVKVLGSKTDPKNPMAGKLVGGCEESVDRSVAEDLISKVKKSLDDYLKSAEDNHKRSDRDIIKKKKVDRDLGKRPKEDHELIAIATPAPPDLVIPECSFPVKSFTFEDGNICEVHGNELTGFEIRRGNKIMPSKFRTVDEAMLALELYNARNKQHHQFEEESQDYLDEN